MKGTSTLMCFAKMVLPVLCSTLGFSQTSITRVYTDHNGFYTSTSSSPSTVDVATHHLIAFQTGSTVWSTGVNDAALTANGVTFSPQIFQAMPATVTGSSGGALIGIGRQYGGYTGSNGCAPPVSPAGGSNVSYYITDGINGLDLSTAVFNLGGNIFYTVDGIDSSSVGDGIPDIVVTQAGDINSSVWDKFSFRDASNHLVGSAIDVNFSSVTTVLKPTWKFFTISGLGCGASSAATRDMRLLAFDFADLGITSSNYMDVVTFRHQLTPNSDIAFVAYNMQSIRILPIDLLSFDAELVNKEVQLKWQTTSEINNDYFTVERSKDASNWEEVLVRDGAGNSNELLTYKDIDRFPLSGISYYRLKQTDFNGETSYSDVVMVNNENTSVTLYPNPADTYLKIDMDGYSFDEPVTFRMKDITGKAVLETTVKGNNDQINIKSIARGVYYAELTGNAIIHVQKIVVR